MISESSKRAVTQLCRDLIGAESLSGQESLAVECMKNAFHALGFSDVRMDSYGSVVGFLEGNRPGPRVLFDAHIDTVPVEGAADWTHAPFAGEIADGRLYGRGASDMKGALAAMTVAAAAFADSHDRKFAGSVCVAAVVCEELFEGLGARSVCDMAHPDYVVIGEASEMNLKIGQRGRAEVVVETAGIPAHSANPQKGVSAVTSMRKLLDEIDRLAPPHSHTLGDGILVLTDLISRPYPGSSVLPKHCEATFDRRLLTGETAESVLSPIWAIIDRLSAEDPAFHARTYLRKGAITCYTGASIEATRFFPAWEANPEEDYVQAAFSSLRGVNPETRLSAYSFCTNGSYYAGEAGIKTIGYGPSLESLAHTTDESISLDALYESVEGYQAILQALTTL
ncbi:MAG: YgeY family selenium metabolism-linked hydrolase [Christensenella sp.]|nr:YgeY family selenium metabolism-linked hydrolase [Christensenella sp.]